MSPNIATSEPNFTKLVTLSIQLKWLCCISLTEPDDAPTGSSTSHFPLPYPFNLWRSSYIHKPTTPHTSSTSQSSPTTKYFNFWALDGEAPCAVVEREVVSLTNPRHNCFDGPFFFYSFFAFSSELVVLYVREGHLSNCLMTSTRHV